MFSVPKVWVTIMCSLTVLYVLRRGLYEDYPLIDNMIENTTSQRLVIHSETETIFIGATICGSERQSEKALMMMKSAILFRGKLHVHFLIVCVQPLQQHVHDELEILLVKVGNVFTYEIKDIYFPKKGETLWRYRFKECCSERLFYPYIFNNVELMVHIDNDVLFLNELSYLWHHAQQMKKSQMFASAPDSISPEGIAAGRLKPPFEKALSVNSGVLIMNLTKMAKFGWVPYVQQLVELYPNRFPYIDQDIIRFAALFHPDILYPLSCNYNFNQWICLQKTPCKDAETDGIYILHGSSGAFRWNEQFKKIMDAFQKYRFGVDPKKRLIALLKTALESMNNKFCGFSSTVISNNTFKALVAN